MKKLKTILKLTVFAGILIILGTAGASDLGRLSVLEGLSQIILGSIFIFCGSAGLNLIKFFQSAKRKRIGFQRCKTHERKATARVA